MSPTVSAMRVKSLLVVDDSAVQRAQLVALCRRLDVPQVHEASGGAQALALLAALPTPPQLMIIDLEMPGMDGIELIQRLGRLPQRIPLIVASSRELMLIHAVETMAHNLGLTVLAAMQKPLQAQALRVAMQQSVQAAGAAVPAPAPASTASSADLAQGLAAGQISVHYQPKVDIRTGIIRGFEALARWHRPGIAPVRPDHFVALAEREGLIHALTMSVMAQAMAQAAQWKSLGLSLPMAINLSPRLLDQPTLVDEVCTLASRHGVQPAQLVLEITESSLVDCAGNALGVLARLRLKGFGLSIDDYGTGYSSMQQLSRIAFTELKIDRSFVHGAHQCSPLRVILRSALDMARQLELSSVAEGIETLADWQLLQECGCDIGQGYLIARPMAAAEMPRWLKQHQAKLHTLRPATVAAAAR